MRDIAEARRNQYHDSCDALFSALGDDMRCFLVALACMCVIGAPAAFAQDSNIEADVECVAFPDSCADSEVDGPVIEGEGGNADLKSRARPVGMPVRTAGNSGPVAPAVTPPPRRVSSRPAPPARVASTRRPARMMPITFELGTATMTPQGRANARELADVLRKPRYAGIRFRVEGHTDSIGDPDFNQQLSEDRAAAVVEYLVSKDVPRDQLSAAGFGLKKPLPGIPTTSPANRRVQLIRAE